MVHPRAFVAVAMVALAAGCVLAARAADPNAEDAAGDRAAAPALAGAWSRAGELDEALGFPAAKEAPTALAFTPDDKPGARWAEDEGEEIRAELDRLGHKLVATAQVRQGEKPAREWIITHRDGNTYGCVVVPNLGLLENRLALVPGATADRDLLFVEWGAPDGGQRLVSAYRRGPATGGARRGQTPPRQPDGTR